MNPIQFRRKFQVAVSLIVMAGLLLAACARTPTAQELSGSAAGETAVNLATQLPVTGESAPTITAPAETALPTEAPVEETATRAPAVPSSTPAPTQTSPPPPTATRPPPTATQPAARDDRFSLSSANGVSPDDIIREMTVAVEGKGDGYCFDKSEPVFLNSNERFLMEAVYVSICGWDPNEEITFTVYDPQGRVQSVTERPEERDGQAVFRARYQPRLDDPTGNYYFELVSSTSRQEWSVTYNAPSGPHLYILSDNRFRPRIHTNFDSYRLLFSGFQPGEDVRLYAYQVNGRDENDNETRELVGWQDYEMNDQGALEIESDARNLAFLAYGQQSGEVHLFTLKAGGGDRWDWFGRRDYYCQGALPPRLTLNDGANVERDVDLRDSPGSSGLVSTLAAGGQVFPQEGPRCADGAFWWLVFDDNGNPGWVPESQDGEYLLRKVE